MTRRLTLGNVNAGGQTFPKIRGMLTGHDVGVMVVTEAKRARAAMKTLALALSFARIHPTKNRGTEAPNIAVLVDKDHDLQRHRFLKMSEPWWWGPSSSRLRKRAPRVYPELVVDGLPILAAHFPPAPLGGGRPNGKNKAAGQESIDAVLDWARGRQECAILGDFNMDADDVERLIARPLNGTVIRGGKVDHAVIVGAKKVSRDNLPEKSGQHGRFVTTIETE